MTQYYIREGQGKWQKTRANSLAGAKRAATRAQFFQGTNLYVGAEANGRIWPISAKYADHIDRSLTEPWQAVDPDVVTCGDVGVVP